MRPRPADTTFVEISHQARRAQPRHPAWISRLKARARDTRGVAVVELALVILPLTLVVFTSIDLGRMAQYQNRVTNSAREGVATLAVHPGWVSGCDQEHKQDRSVTNRAKTQNADLASMASYTVKAYKGSGPFTTANEITGNEITGCTDGFPPGVVAGSKVSVVVSVRVSNNSPLSGPFIGASTVIQRSATATVQG